MVKEENIGAIYDTDGTTPLNYIVVIDAGSSGSRAHIYSYRDSKGIPFSQGVQDTRLLKRIGERDDDDDKTDDEDETDDEEEADEEEDKKKKPEGKVVDEVEDEDTKVFDEPETPNENKLASDKSSTTLNPTKNILPTLSKQGHNWVKKIKPGLSAFSGKPEAVGKKHLKSLLKYAKGVVPKSQHSRTPIFLHATAGLRVLKPTDSNALLDAACKYIQKKTDFFAPDCKTAVSMIDGEVEGIFGWLSTNYLLGGLQDPDTFLHGKNKDHFTFGLLEMGGASTQVTFVPNVTETDTHRQNMYTLNLPSMEGTKDLSFQISSTTYLRFGVNEVHKRVLDVISDKKDPCTPEGLITVYNKKTHEIIEIKESGKIKDKKNEEESDDIKLERKGVDARGNTVEIVGTGDFAKCQALVAPLAEEMRASDSQPQFDFDTNHFIGVSEYWDTAHDGFDLGGRFDHLKLQAHVKSFCESGWDAIQSSKYDLTTSDLQDLCLRSSWVLAVVEHGLGIPVTELGGTSEESVHSEELEGGFASPLQSANTIRGTKYSWTLGRALLYAAAEQSVSADASRTGILSNLNLGSNHFLYGAADPPRPKFDPKSVAAFKVTDHDDDDDDDDHDDDHDDDDDWDDFLDKHSHRLWGSLVFLFILLVIVYLLLGKLRRRQIWQSFTAKFPSLGQSRYTSTDTHTTIFGAIGAVVGSVLARFGVYTASTLPGSSGPGRKYRRMAPDADNVEDLELGTIGEPGRGRSDGELETGIVSGSMLQDDDNDNFSISSEEQDERELLK